MCHRTSCLVPLNSGGEKGKGESSIKFIDTIVPKTGKNVPFMTL